MRYAKQLRIIGAAARNKVRSLVGDSESMRQLEKAILDNAFGGSGENSRPVS
jgi:hypothetical protein